MLRVFAVALVVVFGVSCSPLSEDIVGRYSLDEGGSCNSCAEAGPRTMTFRQVEGPDGYESQFQVNYLSHYYLTMLLVDKVRVRV